MKLLRKIALTISILATGFVFSTEVFADSSVTLTGGTAGPATSTSTFSVSVSLAPLAPFVIYSVTCPLAVTGATADSVIVTLGIRCPTLGPCCKFGKPHLSNLGDVGPKNGSGAYQAIIDESGTTTYTNNSVSQIGTGDTLTFTNLDTSATLIVGSCTATPVTSGGNHK